MKILNFIGHSCTGKTTLSTEIFSRNPKSFWLAYDDIKWKISGYHRDTDKMLAADITECFLQALIKKSQSSLIFSDIFFDSEKKYTSFISSLSLSSDQDFINIYLEADEEDKILRFRKRMENCKKNGRTISVMDESLFVENFQKKIFIPKNTLRIHTSKMTKEEALEKIEELL